MSREASVPAGYLPRIKIMVACGQLPKVRSDEPVFRRVMVIDWQRGRDA